MNRVYFEIIHHGTGERRFDGRCLVVECHNNNVAALRKEIQSYIDAWVSDERNKGELDQFGDAKSDMTSEEFLSIFPDHLHARMSDHRIRSAFI